MSYPDRPDLPPRFNRRGSRHLRAVQHSGLERDAQMAQHAPRVSWAEFWPLFDWRQSEHVALIGPNGQGKTTLLISILPKRTYVAVLVTKHVMRRSISLSLVAMTSIGNGWTSTPISLRVG